MNKYLLKLLIVIVLSGVSCKKKHCSGTNTISGVLQNGTTLSGIKNVQLKFTLYDVRHDQTENENVVGYIMTDDTGGFHFEYPCQDKQYDKIAIDAQPPYGGYVQAREPYSTNLRKTFYYATQGSAQIVITPKSPKGSDTLFVGIQDISGKFTTLDSFANSVPTYWKKFYGKTGGNGAVVWGRGKNNFNQAMKDLNLQQWQRLSISGDPAVDSIFVKY